MTREELRELCRGVRRFSEALCAPLATEDYVVQTMPDVSPSKWHLGHTSWFFETFVLQAALPGYVPHDPRYATLFNSYYNTVGVQHPRPTRGHLSRPTVEQVYAYRRHVDQVLDRFFANVPSAVFDRFAQTVEVGINHEEQHQELILTDIKHVLASNPMRPAYRDLGPASAGAATPLEWVSYSGGVVEVGAGDSGFAFDNEAPRHRVYLAPFALASRPATCGDFLGFIADGGYERPDLWLSDGWAARQAQSWRAPLYWEEREGRWSQATLGGLRPVEAAEPVCHVSYYEADAYARWSHARLPQEEEWEIAAAGEPVAGNFVEEGRLHPRPADGSGLGPRQLFGDVWEWTSSPYVAYPGYQPFAGSLGEYNGKFMCNQLVLRGGSCVTSRRHVRATYRNFFPPDARWQFSGIRLAR